MTDEGERSLIEEFMPEVEEIAGSFYDGSLPEEDLLQEGYVGLMEGIKMLRYEDPDFMPLSVSETIRNSIREAVERAVSDYNDRINVDDRLVAQVERLNQSIDRLTEELGSKPNIDEIANDMRIPQEKVLEIIKLTGSDPEVSDAAIRGVSG